MIRESIASVQHCVLHKNRDFTNSSSKIQQKHSFSKFVQGFLSHVLISVNAYPSAYFKKPKTKIEARANPSYFKQNCSSLASATA
jgi:hypothetical protein